MLTIKRLDLEDARSLLKGAREKATEIGVPMCIAITDESGNLVAFERMDGGKVTSITIAIDKSYTASGAKKATHEYGEASQPGPRPRPLSDAPRHHHLAGHLLDVLLGVREAPLWAAVRPHTGPRVGLGLGGSRWYLGVLTSLG